MAIPCRFSTACTRPDCYFGHPDGRFIDGDVAKGVPNAGAQPGESPAVAMGNVASTFVHANVCRYGVSCRRVGCYFMHPEGRQIDNAKHGSVVEEGRCGGAESTRSNTKTTSMDELTRGFSNLSAESEIFLLTDQELRDTWFSKAMDCDCCKGFIYGCTNDICQNLKMCMCHVEQGDLDQTPEDVCITMHQDQ